jgi:hypothetical protein
MRLLKICNGLGDRVCGESGHQHQCGQGLDLAWCVKAVASSLSTGGQPSQRLSRGQIQTYAV